MNVVALAGGVGGARLADGLAQVLPPENLTVVVNTGDDFEHLGLYICPDLDTVCYTLAGIANPQTGWGRVNETWHVLESLGELAGPTWFRLGDRDLGTHLLRSHRLQRGDALSEITRDFCRAWGIEVNVLPMSDQPVRTKVFTEQGELDFQEYFVRQACQPRVSGFRFEGADEACPTPGVLEALLKADLVVICPSNPWVSIQPILAVPGIISRVQRSRVVAVSPIIGDQTVKGPAAKMFAEMGIAPSAVAVARQYSSFLDGFVVDQQDHTLKPKIEVLGIAPYLTDILMRDRMGRCRLAEEVLEFGRSLREKSE